MTDPRLDEVTTAVYRFPTESPEADGTLTWDATTAVVVTLRAGEHTGVGWTYGSPALAALVNDHLAGMLRGRCAWDIAAGWSAVHRACRNVGTRGPTMMAISAVDIAWWDLKARLLDAGLTTLLGRCRDAVPVYGSGGFTTFGDDQLAEQVAGWQTAGATSMKIKIAESAGTRIDRDLDRVQLDVTRCGGYTGWLRGAALAQARNREVSAHRAPALHAPVAAAVPNLRHVEWFADHARLEPLLADGVPPATGDALWPDPHSVGHGLALAADAERFRVG